MYKKTKKYSYGKLSSMYKELGLGNPYYKGERTKNFSAFCNGVRRGRFLARKEKLK